MVWSYWCINVLLHFLVLYAILNNKLALWSDLIWCVDISLQFPVTCSTFSFFLIWNITVVSEHNLGSAYVVQQLCHQKKKILSQKGERGILIETRDMIIQAPKETKEKLQYQERRMKMIFPSFFSKPCKIFPEKSRIWGWKDTKNPLEGFYMEKSLAFDIIGMKNQ